MGIDINAFEFHGMKSLAVTATSGSVQLTDMGSNSGCKVQIWNKGPSHCFIRFDPDSAPTAVTTDMCIPPGTIQTLVRPNGAPYMAAICDSGDTATLYANSGMGV